jgi:hypothetical protein
MMRWGASRRAQNVSQAGNKLTDYLSLIDFLDLQYYIGSTNTI